MFNQLMRLMRRFRRWLTQVWDNFIDWVNPPQPPRSNSPRLPDHEYEWLFRQLLTQVGQGWNRDQVRRWLRRNEYRVTESRWLEWFPRFHHSAKDPEISRQLLLLKQLDCEYISQIAANLLGETPPKPPLRETNPPPITPPPNHPPTSTDSLPTDAERWFNDGLQKGLNGDFRGAISSFDKALKIKPDFHEAWNYRGNALSDLGEYEKAIYSFDQAIKIKPDYPEAWNNRGLALGNLGEYEQAIYSFDQAIKIKPDFPEAWANRGNALYNLGKYEKALSSYDQALKIKPDFHEAWNYRGNALSYLGEYEKAIYSFDQAIKFKPDFHEAWNYRGNALSDLGKYEKAIYSFDQAIKIKPDFHEAWNDRGIALSDLGEYEKALSSYDQALKFKPDFHEAWNNRGIALSDLGEYEKAIYSFDQAIKFKPDYYTAWNNRGIALSGLGEYEKAIYSFDQAIKFKPDYYTAWNYRGNALSDLGEYEKAIYSFDQAIKIKPDDHIAWNNRGNALSDLEEYEKALSSYDQAIKFKPDYHLAWANRGNAAGRSRSNTAFIVPDINSPRLSEILQNPSLDLRDYPGKIASYQQGLKHCPKSTHPNAWGYLHHVIGKARYFRGQFATPSHRITDELGQPQTARYYYQQAVESYQEALTVITPDADRKLYLTIVIDLISALCKLGENQSARQWHQQGFATLQTWINQIYHRHHSQPETVSLSPPVNPEDETPQLVPGNFREYQSIPAVKRLRLKFSLFYRFAFDFASQDHNWHQALETAELEKNIYLTWLLSTASQPADISPTVAQIQTLVKAETALIYWYYSSHSLTTFILTRDDLTAIPFSASAQEKLETFITHWHRDYQNYSLKKTSDSQSWQQRLKKHIDSMQTLLSIPEITAKLPPEIRQLILIPHRDLHRLPLEALFPHDFITTRLPSAAFGYGHSSSPPINPNSEVSVLTVAYPDSIGAKNLPFTETEVTAIGQVFAGYHSRYQTITDKQATEETVISALTENHQIFHFSGHGDYDHEKPNLSSLLLSGSGRLRGEKIASLSLTSYGLVYLNACETGLTNIETIEKEYVGLASAFLRGGVSQVVSSLWLVNDESAGVLAIKFYQEYLGGETAAVALHKAKNWLRFEATWAEIAKVYQCCLSHPSLTDKNQGILLKALGRIERQEDPEVKPFSDVYYWSSLVISGY